MPHGRRRPHPHSDDFALLSLVHERISPQTTLDLLIVVARALAAFGVLVCLLMGNLGMPRGYEDGMLVAVR